MDDVTTLCSLAHELGHAYYGDPPGHHGPHELRADRFTARLHLRTTPQRTSQRTRRHSQSPQNPAKFPRKNSSMKKLLPLLTLSTLIFTGCSNADTQQQEKKSVNVAGQDWDCLPAPDETMQRILDGDKRDDGTHATVDKAVMVQGEDNNFIAANITWEGENEPFTADFTAPKDGSGPITSASPGTAQLFNWPETPGGPYDGTNAAKECLG